MICAEFERLEEEWRVDAEFQGYGNANIIEAFKMEGIDIIKVLENMKVGEKKIYNIGWWSGCGIAKRGIHFGSNGVWEIIIQAMKESFDREGFLYEENNGV